LARKKKKSEIIKREIVSSWEDWTVGDFAWAENFSDKKPIYCELKEFHPTDKLGPSVTVIDQVAGCFKTVLVSSLSDTQLKKKRKPFLRKAKRK
jgi:hypothetical protein